MWYPIPGPESMPRTWRRPRDRATPSRYHASMTPSPTQRGRAFAVGLLLAAAAAAQPPAPAPAPAPIAPDPALPEKLKELKTLVGDAKMRDDFQAVSLIQHLATDPDKKADKDREKLAKAFGEVLRVAKVRPAGQDMIYREAADGLGKLGELGAKELAKAVVDKRFDDNLPLRTHLVLALGRTQDEKQIDWLLDTTTRSPHDDLRGAAAEALASYLAMDLKLRREVVKQILRSWGSLHEQATTLPSTDPSAPIPLQPQNARETLRKVEGKWVRTLQHLTGQTQSAFADWQRWLNKNPNWTPTGTPK